MYVRRVCEANAWLCCLSYCGCSLDCTGRLPVCSGTLQPSNLEMQGQLVAGTTVYCCCTHVRSCWQVTCVQAHCALLRQFLSGRGAPQ